MMSGLACRSHRLLAVQLYLWALASSSDPVEALTWTSQGCVCCCMNDCMWKSRTRRRRGPPMFCSLLGSLSHFRTHCAGATVQQSLICADKRGSEKTLLSRLDLSQILKSRPLQRTRVCKGSEQRGLTSLVWLGAPAIEQMDCLSAFYLALTKPCEMRH